MHNVKQRLTEDGFMVNGPYDEFMERATGPCGVDWHEKRNINGYCGSFKMKLQMFMILFLANYSYICRRE